VKAANSSGSSTATSTPTSLVQTASAKLTWAPPALTNPITVPIQDTGQACPSQPGQNTSQPQVCYLAANQDYILKVGHRSGDGGLSLTGGRNIVMIGGTITPGPHECCDRSDEWRSRALSFKYQTGIVHIEGMVLESASDAILPNAPQAIFQIENVRIVNLHAHQDNIVLAHPDMGQSFDTFREFRVDHLTGDSDYQGFSWFAGTNGFPVNVTLKNINLNGNLQPNTVLKWPDGTTQTRTGFHIVTYMNYTDTVHACENCWMVTGWYNQTWQRRLYESIGLLDSAGNEVSYSFRVTGYDGQVATSRQPGTSNIGRREGDYIEFPLYPNMAGVRWYWGVPVGGDFVPPGLAGANYTTPGYSS
jgi:hypothetical protein